MTKALILLYFFKRYFKSFERNVEIDLEVGSFSFSAGEKQQKSKQQNIPEKEFFQKNMPDSSMTKTASVMSTNENEKDKNTRIDLGDVTPHNIKLLKKVNQVVFPIVYHDKFYKDVLEAGELAKLAYYNDVVGKFVEYLWITF